MTKRWGFHNWRAKIFFFVFAMIEKQLGFAILHQPKPRVLPRCRQLVRKRKRKSKPWKIYQRLLQSKAKQFWYQLAWYQQLWSNNYHHSNNDPKVDGSCKKEDWQTSNNPKKINPVPRQRLSNVKKCVGWSYLRRNPAAMDESALTAPYKMRTRPTVWTPKAQVMKP